MNGTAFAEIQRFLSLGDQHRGNDNVLALQYYACAGTLAQGLGERALEVRALRREIATHLDREDLEAAAGALAELVERAPEEAADSLQEVVGRGEQLGGLLERIGGARLPPAPRAELFGRLQLSYRGRTVTSDRWPGSRALRLFACLLARQPAPINCQDAIEMLWSDCSPKRGRNRLRNTVYQIRHVLGDLLGIPGAGVRRCRHQDSLSLEPSFDTDTDELERLAEEAERLEPAEALVQLKRAFELCQSELLEGMRDGWAQAMRARFTGTRARVAHLLVQGQLARGQAQAAERTARRTLEQDAMSEQAWIDLLTVQVALGRDAEARRLYRQAVLHFETELGFRPLQLGEAFDHLLAPPGFRPTQTSTTAPLRW